MEIRVRSAQAPESRGPPFRSDLDTLRDAQQSVAELRGKQVMNRGGIVLEENRTGEIFAQQIVIVIVKARYADARILAQQPPVARFVPLSCSGAKSGLALNRASRGSPLTVWPV